MHSCPVVVSLHPRTRDRLKGEVPRSDSESVWLMEPFGLIDFVHLERAARVVLTDSGTVQEECAIFGVPSVILRDVTERHEVLERGASLLAGLDHESVLLALRTALSLGNSWTPPDEYLVTDVSDRVIRILLSHNLKASVRV